jgi:hypothetical protein
MTIYRRVWKTASGAVRRAWIVEWYVDGRRFRRQFKTQSEAAAFAESQSLGRGFKSLRRYQPGGPDRLPMSIPDTSLNI